MASFENVNINTQNTPQKSVNNEKVSGKLFSYINSLEDQQRSIQSCYIPIKNRLKKSEL